jgi:hypothetical protein
MVSSTSLTGLAERHAPLVLRNPISDRGDDPFEENVIARRLHEGTAVCRRPAE